MNKKTNHYILLAGIIFISVVGFFWLLQTPSPEEAFGDLGRLWDARHGFFSGWSPHFLLGSNLVIQQVAIWIILLSNLAIVIFGPLIGGLAAFKFVVIFSLAASGVTMFCFVRRLTRDETQAAVAGLAYIMMPSITVAMGIYEHFSVTLCFVFVPLILRGILVLSEEGSPREIVGLGLAASAIALSYTKIAVVISPMLLLWTLEVLRLQPTNVRLKIVIRYAMSAGIALILALPFLLPASREFGFAAGFLFDPLEGWQHHYAFKSALQWIDLWGIFMKGSGLDVERDAAMFAIGLVPLIAISLGLGLSALEEWRRSFLGRWFLILVACWLLSMSLAAGPDGILLGHWHLLKSSAHDMSDVAIPCLWLALAWLAWIAYQTIHHLIGGKNLSLKSTDAANNCVAPVLASSSINDTLSRCAPSTPCSSSASATLKRRSTPWRSWLLLAVFLATPFFRIVAAFPLFKDIRAPESFWSVGGFCVLAAAVGMVTVVLFTKVISSRFRVISAIGIGLLFLLELYPIHSAYWTRGLPEELFADYDQSLTFLKNAPLPGRVHPLCSRYFYLTIPQKTGHSLSTEALLRHFELKWVRHFEAAGMANIETMKSYLNLAGVSYIFIDKEDPLTPKQAQDIYRSFFPVVFENRSIAILANESSLYPAFLARNFVALPLESYPLAPMALQLARMNLLSVELAQVDQRQTGFAGKSTGNNQVELLPQYQKNGGAPFQRVASLGNRADDYGKMTYRLPPAVSGWLTVTEAFHPDWTATIDGQPADIHRAAAALLAVYVPLGSQEIIFKFAQPYWYLISFYLGCFFWFVALGEFIFFRTRWARPAWKDWWN